MCTETFASALCGFWLSKISGSILERCGADTLGHGTASLMKREFLHGNMWKDFSEWCEDSGWVLEQL